MKYVSLSRSTDYNNINIYIDTLSVDSMKQKQLNKQLKHAKLSELENEYNIINYYDTAYHDYHKDETFTDTHNLGNKCY